MALAQGRVQSKSNSAKRRCAVDGRVAVIFLRICEHLCGHPRRSCRQKHVLWDVSADAAHIFLGHRARLVEQ